MIVFIMFVILVALICINVPIAVGLAVAAIFGLAVTEGVDSIVTLALDMYDGSTKFSLIAIPMFVLAGAIMNAGGITDKLINFVNAIIGFVRGGLAMVNIGVSLFFAEISGSAVADVAALGSVLIPQMKKRGYSAPLAAAVTSSSASLAIIIPPVDSDDSVCDIGRYLGRTTLCCRNYPGSSRRVRPDGDGSLFRKKVQLAYRGSIRIPSALEHVD